MSKKTMQEHAVANLRKAMHNAGLTMISKAALVELQQQAALAEQERCVAICEKVAGKYKNIWTCHLNQDRGFIARSCAKAIRES